MAENDERPAWWRFWPRRAERRRDRVVVVEERSSPWTLVMQFFLTTVIGSFLLGLYQEEQARRAFVDGSFERVEDFLEATVVRRERGDLVRSSLRRGAAIDELVGRKEAYDQSYIDFNASYTKAIIGLRGGFDSRRQTMFECAINRYLITWFSKLDGCFTNAYDEAMREARADGRSLGALVYPQRLRAEHPETGSRLEEGWPEAALATLDSCSRSLANSATPGPDAPTLSTRVMSRYAQTCATTIAQLVTDERDRARGLLARSHDALWGDTAPAGGWLGVAFDRVLLWTRPEERGLLADMAGELDETCGLGQLRETFATDPKFEGALDVWCAGLRAER